MIIDDASLEWRRWPKGSYVWHCATENGEFGGAAKDILTVTAWPKTYQDNFHPDDFWNGPLSYRPMTNKTILKKFCKTSPTREGIIPFVEKFGLLGIVEDHDIGA